MGTHPIFESDFDCLTEMDDDFDFICNYLNEHSHEKNLIDRIKSEICEKEKELEKLDGLIKRADEKVEKIGQLSTDESPIDASIESKTTLIREYERAVQYHQLIAYVSELHCEMNLVARDNLENALPLFEKLKALSAKCAESSCLKLRLGFLDKLLLEWHTTLKAPFEKQVESELTKVGFPFKNGSSQFVISKPLSDALITLKKKFGVFFYKQNSKLNDASKPEYYLAVLLRWLTDHKRFVEHLEELFERFSASFEFYAAVVRLGSEKVKNDLRIINDDYVFSHLLDEVLSHDGDLLEFEPKLTRSSRPIMVIENDYALIDKWLRLELTHARESMDNIINDEQYWVNKSDVASLAFFEILQLTTRRCRRLCADVRLRFYVQQLEIVDEFRLALHQISDVDRISHERVCAIVNTVHCIHTSLSEWEEVVPYSRMLEMSSEFQSKHDHVMRNLVNLADSLSNTLVLHAIEDIQHSDGLLDSYRATDFSHIRENDVSEISLNFVPILSKVQIHLQQFDSGLLEFVYRSLSKLFAAEIDRLLALEVFERNRKQHEINKFSVIQISNDVNSALIPLFHTVIPNPRALFPQLDAILQTFNLGQEPELDFC